MLVQDDFADMFYRRLFELDPDLRALFKGEMAEQGRKLMKTIGIAVAHLRNPEEILDAVKDLGRRHVDYGVKAEDYGTVGSALIYTLRQTLGAGWTPELLEAWTNMYEFVSQAMQSYEPSPA